MTEIPHGHAHTKTQPWVYAVGVGIGALGLLYWFHSNKAAGSAAPATVDSSSGYPVLTSDPLGSSGGGGSAGGGNMVPDTAPQSNSAWEATAIAWLVTQGKNPLTAQTALEQYLAGNPLTSDQGALVSLVVGKYGLPPQGSAGPPIVAPAPTPAPTPGPVPAPPPPVHTPITTPVPTIPRPSPPPPHITVVKPPTPAPSSLGTYTVRPGDTLSAIALHYYGHATPFYWMKIAAANGIANPNLIHPGQVLRIPR